MEEPADGVKGRQSPVLCANEERVWAKVKV